MITVAFIQLYEFVKTHQTVLLKRMDFTVYKLYFNIPGFFWLCRKACGILVPRPGIEPGPSAVKARSPNHWTAREFPNIPGLKKKM